MHRSDNDFARVLWWAQVAEILLGIDGDDGRKYKRLWIYWLLSSLVGTG